MTNYLIYFSLYGKKMKIHLEAKNEKIAKEKIRNSVIFHKITENIPKEEILDFNELFPMFGDIFKPKSK